MTAAPRRLTIGRISCLIAGGFVALIGLPLALVGGTILSHDGVDLGEAELSVDGYAAVSESLDWREATYLGASIVRASFQVTAEDGTTPLLVALATPQQAQRIAGETTIVEVGAEASYAEYTALAGHDPRTELSGGWSAEATGPGEATLTFESSDQGERALVIMNARGEPLGDIAVTSRGEAPSVTPIAVVLLSAGIVLLLAAVPLIGLPLKRARQ